MNLEDKLWDSAWDSAWDSVEIFVMNGVRYSVWNYVRNSVYTSFENPIDFKLNDYEFEK